jgi:succinyl-CoA synthetase beta subunit
VAARGSGEGVRLNEPDSLVRLAELGIPTVAHETVTSAAEVARAFDRLAAEQVVVKGSTAAVSHKSDLGLVALGCDSAEAAVAAAELITASARAHDVPLDGFLVAPMVAGLHEVVVGASVDPVFGPVMLIGAGGLYVETVPDTQVLLAPCTADEVHEAVQRLRLAPLLAGVRGAPAADVDAWVKAVVRASESMAAPGAVVGFDANPVLLLEAGQGVVAVDAVVLVAD